MSATATAKKLGIRREWAMYAVWPEDGILRFLPTYPSIRFGNYLNEAVQITTSNKLYYRDGEMYTIADEVLDWFQAETRTTVAHAEPFHCMAHTRLEVFANPSMIVKPSQFLEEYDDYADGLHPDLLSALEQGEMDIYVVPNQQVNHDEVFTKRSFDLYRLMNIWRKRMTSDQVSGFEVPENRNSRLIFGITGQQTHEGGVKVASVFFGQRFPSPDKGWIIFLSVELFEQMLLSWVDTMTCESMTRHLDHCGFIIPHEADDNSVRP